MRRPELHHQILAALNSDWTVHICQAARSDLFNFIDFLWKFHIPARGFCNHVAARNLLHPYEHFKIAGPITTAHLDPALLRHMGQDEHFKKRRSGWAQPLNLFGWVLLSTAFWGCTGLQDRYMEQHAIKNLTVVFLDEQSLREQWKHVAGTDAVRFASHMNSNVPLVNTVQGFYDFASNTLYCPKWNFEICGHELHHAALGHFHASD